MSTTQPQQKTTAIDAQNDELDERGIRALLTPMTVIDNCGDVAGIDGMFEVTTDSGSCYTVSLRSGDGACTCPDHEYRDVRCKHIRRCEFETGRRAIPADVNLDALDDQLGEHVTEGQPRIAMTDGGVAQKQASQSSRLTSRPKYIEIGIDGNGNRHCYDTVTESVHIVHPDGTRERAVIDPAEHTIISWIAHIRSAHGWDSMEMWRSQLHALIPSIDEREDEFFGGDN